MSSSTGKTAIAIVGVSTIFPGSSSPAGFWRDILSGRDRLTEVPRTHWLREDYFEAKPGTPDKVYVSRGGFLPDVEFSPLEFGLPPNTLPATDTAQLLSLVVAKRVLAEATRGRFESMDRSRMSVVLGVASATELVGHMSGRLQLPIAERAMRAAGLAEDEVARIRDILSACYTPWQENTFPGLLGNVVAGRIANRLDLGGTNSVVDAACASSLAAIHIGVNELVRGQSDLVITGGVDTLNDIFMFMCFAQTGALSLSGDCHPFAEDSDGTMLGEGIGMVALKRLADAERDGDAIYGVIRGIGSSSDGRAKSIYAPAAAGQMLALRRAYEEAGYGPDTVELVEAHGTATKAGDAAEFEALKAVFSEAGAATQHCALGSVKAQIGHTKAAAGAAGLVKALMALHHKALPPTTKVKAPNPALAITDSPFYLNTEARPWVGNDTHPRRASVSALGFGGTNFHVALEEYVGVAPKPQRLRTMASELVVLSGATKADVVRAARALSSETGQEGALIRVAKRTQLAFDAKAPARLAIVAESDADLRSKLETAAALVEKTTDASFSTPQGIHFGTARTDGDVAFLFPGQGSQYVGMGADLAIHFDCARAEWDRAASTGVSARVFPPPVFDDAARAALTARLTETEWAQPALAVASLAILRVLQRAGLQPKSVAGHSLGELTALAVAGAIAEADLVKAARRRGQLCGEAAKVPGAMLAVVADIAKVEALIREWGSDVVVANHNAPAQVVLAGAVGAIDDVEAKMKAAGLTAKRLRVATAFHSPVVGGACAPFRQFLNGIELGASRLPVYANATAAVYPRDAVAMRDQLAGAIAQPVRFVAQIEAMYAAGTRTFVEVGPEGVLTKLVGQCLAGRPHVAVATDSSGKPGTTSLWQAFARLSTAGLALDFAALWEGEAVPVAPVVDKLSMTLTGANYAKPVPDVASARAAAAQPPRPPAPAPVAPAPAALPSPVVSMQQLHAPAIAAQMEFQRLMAESHIAFLRAIESSTHGQPMQAMPAMPVMQAVPAMVAAPPLARVAPAPAPAPAPRAVVAAVAPPQDLSKLMLMIVAEKTGYPAEMIEPTMDLESDLGIDSIKRVEILSAVRERAPGLPPVDPARMSAMRTLAEIVSYLGVAAPVAVAATAAPVMADLNALMLSVVAAKTGYPAEMIEPTMDLESDLGIDSIKRVEILSAVRERAPNLPAVDPARMSTMRTLAEIVAYLGGANTPAPAAKPAPAAPAPAKLAAQKLVRMGLRAEPRPARGFAVHGLLGGTKIAVTGADDAVARALAKRLGGHVTEAVPADADVVIFLGGLKPVASIDDALATDREAFAVAHQAATRFKAKGGTFITVQDTGGDFGISGRSGLRAWLGGVGALAKTAAEEWPLATVRAIDLERGTRSDDEVAEALVSELLEGGPELEVGLPFGGERVVIVDGPATDLAQTKERSPIPKGALFVVSGGARGVTAASILELARAAQPTFLLLGRSPLADEPAAFVGATTDADLKRIAMSEAKRTPKEISERVDAIVAAREVRATLAALKEAGSEARYAAVDVRDPEALGAVLTAARRDFGPVRGLVHGAGVLSDAFLEKKTQAMFDRVFDTKVLGLRALLDATANDPLAWLCLFSSVAARTGNAGQADYAMANEVLNHVAAVEARRRGDTCRVVSIGWGPWEGGMVTPALQKHFEARGVTLLPIADGARAFVHELGTTSRDINVVVGGDVRGRVLAAKLEADVLVDERTWPQLASHRIQGKVVLPMVIALEWFARLVQPIVDAGSPLHFRDLYAVRGVPLVGFLDGAGAHFHVTCRPGAGHDLDLELRDASGVLRYSAKLDRDAPPPSMSGGARSALPVSRWNDGDLYGPDALFHGKHFQVLRSIDGMSTTEAQGMLVGTLAAGWPDQAWFADPAALDGALQLAILFGLHADGSTSLPVRIGHIVYHRNTDGGPIHCALKQRDRSKERLLCDLSLAHDDGAMLAELIGVEMFTVPSGTTAHAE